MLKSREMLRIALHENDQSCAVPVSHSLKLGLLELFQSPHSLVEIMKCTLRGRSCVTFPPCVVVLHGTNHVTTG